MTLKIMKYYLTFLLCLMGFSAMAQTKSLEVDCQNPGWLSSLITYPQQQTLENLKVTGYINGTDLKFIRNLNTELSLRGVLDLEDANIVSGGEPFYTVHWNMNYSQDIYTETNKLPIFAFAYLQSWQKVVLPKTITEITNVLGEGYQFLDTYVDTLVINGTMESLTIGDGFDNHFWKTRCVYIPEGVKELNLGYLFHTYSGLTNQEIFFPSTLESVTGSNAATSQKKIVFHCSSTTPENIKVVGYSNNNYSFFDGGTIYVPKGTTENYKKSIFKKLTIIEDIPVEGVQFDTKNTIQYVGDNFTLNASVLPSDALNKEITYEVSNQDVLAMNEDGTLEAKKYGTSKVYAYSKNKEFFDVCEVQVFDKTNGISLIPSISLKIGETYQLEGKTLPENTSDNIVNYSSLDESIAKVDESGLIIGVAKGVTKITASSKDGLHKAECVVKITQPVTSISLSVQNLSLEVGETKTLKATINPSDADNKKIVWTSENPEIATVDDDGVVTALKAGLVKIVATSEENNTISDFCEVTILQPVTGIALNYTEFTLNEIGESVILEATISPEDASNKDVIWKSSNENVCIVSNGQVVAVGYGISVIIASTKDGGYMATCTIKVVGSTDGIANINITNENYTIYSLDGKQVTELSKGIYIIRFSNGEQKKIMIK